jgi:hypothetical protein
MVVRAVGLTFALTPVGHVIDDLGKTLLAVTLNARVAPLSSVIGD